MMYMIMTNNSLGQIMAYLCSPCVAAVTSLPPGGTPEQPECLRQVTKTGMRHMTPWQRVQHKRPSRALQSKGKRLNQPQGRVR